MDAFHRLSVDLDQGQINIAVIITSEHDQRNDQRYKRRQQRNAIAKGLGCDAGMNPDVVQAVKDAMPGMPQKQRDHREDESFAQQVLREGLHVGVAEGIGREDQTERDGDAGNEHQHRAE